MKKGLLFIHILYIFLFISGSVYGIEAKTLLLGGEATWIMTGNRAGVTEVRDLRPYPVLILSSATELSVSGYSAATGTLGQFMPLTESALDLSVPFDERSSSFFHDTTGRYSITVSPAVEAVDRRFSRAGTGAALFNASGVSGRVNNSLVIGPDSRDSLFSPGNRIGDFTLEFWLYPLNLENGEQILSWIASRPADEDYSIQRILCTVSRNRLQWSFVNFFTSADGVSHIDIELSGDSHIVPKTWSHHLIRFDATTGMIEYLVDGISESIVYAAYTGREGSEVYTPVAGNAGNFVLGGHFMGMMDEFKIHRVFARRSSIQKYIPAGGRAETRPVDLGVNGSAVLRIDASGGRASLSGTRINNEFRQSGRLHFSDDSQMHFFIRASDNPWQLSEIPWTSFTPGAELTGNLHGRYVQLAVDFYPSADGETSPYLSEVRITYLPNEPPLPPRNFTVTAVDGGVQLNWIQRPDYAAGYLVYYSSVRGELFGEEASLGPSPIDVGKTNSLFIEGLKNGTLYYFRIAAYDYSNGSIYNIGEFSREVTARPLAGLSLSGN